MRIRVFHNTDPMAMARGYAAEDKVVEVHTCDDTEATYPAGACDFAFYLFNVGDDQQYGTPNQLAIDYRRWGNRSLSVGDVVACGDEFYTCDPRGWTKIAPPTIVTRSQHGTTPLERVILAAVPGAQSEPGSVVLEEFHAWAGEGDLVLVWRMKDPIDPNAPWLACIWPRHENSRGHYCEDWCLRT